MTNASGRLGEPEEIGYGVLPANPVISSHRI